MEIIHEFFGREYLIDFDIKITAPACAATGPTYACGGEPASPMEWEIDGDPEVFSLKYVGVVDVLLREGKWESVTIGKWVRDQSLELPVWLKEAVAEWLHDSDEVACMADELAEEQSHPDPDMMREREYDDARF
jgi:hypothetical protein